MARPKRIEGDTDTPAKIINAARLEFSQSGLSARLEDIGARCGLSRASILHHYESKQILLDAVNEHAINKARERILQASLKTQNDYSATIRGVTLALRQIENEENGTAAVILHAIFAELVSTKLKIMMQELLALLAQSAIQAGAEASHSPELTRAAIAHIVMGELCRLALGKQAHDYWGSADPILPLMDTFFKLPSA
ncbi:TetR/AcrR family transcriptional regulator [Aquirhabdus parva]|nr:helix-turn-helix domain-containing protein [Aquirhabdus parva]